MEFSLNTTELATWSFVWWWRSCGRLYCQHLTIPVAFSVIHEQAIRWLMRTYVCHCCNCGRPSHWNAAACGRSSGAPPTIFSTIWLRLHAGKLAPALRLIFYKREWKERPWYRTHPKIKENKKDEGWWKENLPAFLSLTFRGNPLYYFNCGI